MRLRIDTPAYVDTTRLSAGETLEWRRDNVPQLIYADVVSTVYTFWDGREYRWLIEPGDPFQ